MKWAVFIIAAALAAAVLIMLFILTERKKRRLLINLSVLITAVFTAWAVIMIFTGNSDSRTGMENSYPSINFAKPDRQVLTVKGNSPQIQIPNYNETAVDGLNRHLPGFEETGAPKEDKYVGVFYFLWTSSITTSLDNTKLIAQNPDKPRYGSYGQFHWWSEPETGYHRADDVWQIKRDLYYLSSAGVDFLYIDFTNGFIYEDTFRIFLDVSLELRASGIMTPYIVPWAVGEDSTEKQDMYDLYRIFYSQEKYDDLWFYWEGKPLAMLVPGLSIISDKSMTDYFTFRVCWTRDVVYPGEEQGRWSWPDNDIVNYGYSYGWDEDPEKAEFAGIGAAGFANTGEGRSGEFSKAEYLDKFKETKYTYQGLTFEKAFDEVMKKNPEVEVITISRWNEGVAQFYNVNSFGFVDQYNREFSRDFEPTKYGAKDNYYYQMCSVIRRFKGVSRKDAVSGKTTVSIDGDFGVWSNITPVFKDYKGDTSERSHSDTSGKVTYTNKTGRNDIIESRFAYDEAYLYFYAKTAENLTDYTDRNWMLLFIDSDNNKATGWEGYDFLVNYSVIDGSITTICKYQNNLWQEIALTEYKAYENQYNVRVPRSVIGLQDEKFEIGFHWMDNVTNIYSLYDWFTTGDSAPERRNNYYISASCKYSSENESVVPARSENAIVYMIPDDVESDNLQKGLMVQAYNLPEGYDRQPEIYLLAGRSTDYIKTDKISADAIKKTGAYALKFSGWIYVENDCEYKFTLNSDDGSSLYINERLIVDNTGVHSFKSSSGFIGLSKGYHAVSIEYFECGNSGASLSLDVNGGGYEFYCEK